MIVGMNSADVFNVVFKDWMYDHYPDAIKSNDELAMAIYSFGQFVMREMRDLYGIDIEERSDEE